MSVFNEHREICVFCGDRVNRWDYNDVILHMDRACLKPFNNVKKTIKNPVPIDYITDLSYTLADV